MLSTKLTTSTNDHYHDLKNYHIDLYYCEAASIVTYNTRL